MVYSYKAPCPPIEKQGGAHLSYGDVSSSGECLLVPRDSLVTFTYPVRYESKRARHFLPDFALGHLKLFSALLPKQSHELTQATLGLLVTPLGRSNTWAIAQLYHPDPMWHCGLRHFKGWLQAISPTDQSGVLTAGCDSLSTNNKTTVAILDLSVWLTIKKKACRCVLKTLSGQDTERKWSWMAACCNRKKCSLSPDEYKAEYRGGSEQTSSHKEESLSWCFSHESEQQRILDYWLRPPWHERLIN